MSEQTVAPSESYSTGSLDDNPFVFVLTIVLSVILGSLLYFGHTQWQKQEADDVLKGPAQGAARAYHERSTDLHNLMLISVDVYKTRSPGAYLRALQEWQRAGQEPVAAGKAAWVYELEKAEHKKVQTLLTEQGVTLADIKVMEAKLSKISPQLTDAEAELLKKITDSGPLNSLAMRRHDTVEELFKKLNELGASSSGLRELRMSDPRLRAGNFDNDKQSALRCAFLIRGYLGRMF